MSHGSLSGLHDRIISHIDLDCFYVGVERYVNPSLKDKPVAVVQYNPFGDLRTRRPEENRQVDNNGSIIAISYEARASGVKRNMRGIEAKNLCKDIILVQVPTNHGKADLTIYRKISQEIVKIIQHHTTVYPEIYDGLIVEKASIDEVYLDITKCALNLYNRIEQIVHTKSINQHIDSKRDFLSSKCAASSILTQSAAGSLSFEDIVQYVKNLARETIPDEIVEKNEETLENQSNQRVLTVEEDSHGKQMDPSTAPGQRFADSFLDENDYDGYIDDSYAETEISASRDDIREKSLRKVQSNCFKLAGDDMSELSVSKFDLSKGMNGKNTSSDAISQSWLNRPSLLWSHSDKLLLYGTVLMQCVRESIFQRLSLTCSGGISHNKMLAKIASAMHKPNKITCFPSSYVSSIFRHLTLTRVPGFNGKLGQELQEKFPQIKHIGDFLTVSREELHRVLSVGVNKSNPNEVSNLENLIQRIWLVSRGFDEEIVKSRSLPKSIGCGKTFRLQNMLMLRDIYNQYRQSAETKTDLNENHDSSHRNRSNHSEMMKELSTAHKTAANRSNDFHHDPKTSIERSNGDDLVSDSKLNQIAVHRLNAKDNKLFHWLRELSSELIERCEDDSIANSRIARTFTVGISITIPKRKKGIPLDVPISDTLGVGNQETKKVRNDFTYENFNFTRANPMPSTHGRGIETEKSIDQISLKGFESVRTMLTGSVVATLQQRLNVHIQQYLTSINVSARNETASNYVLQDASIGYLSLVASEFVSIVDEKKSIKTFFSNHSSSSSSSSSSKINPSIKNIPLSSSNHPEPSLKENKRLSIKNYFQKGLQDANGLSSPSSSFSPFSCPTSRRDIPDIVQSSHAMTDIQNDRNSEGIQHAASTAPSEILESHDSTADGAGVRARARAQSYSIEMNANGNRRNHDDLFDTKPIVNDSIIYESLPFANESNDQFEHEDYRQEQDHAPSSIYQSIPSDPPSILTEKTSCSLSFATTKTSSSSPTHRPSSSPSLASSSRYFSSKARESSLGIEEIKAKKRSFEMICESIDEDILKELPPEIQLEILSSFPSRQATRGNAWKSKENKDILSYYSKQSHGRQTSSSHSNSQSSKQTGQATGKKNDIRRLFRGK